MSDNNDDSVDVSNTVLHLFNLGLLKELWSNGDYFEVGQQDIALLIAHNSRDGASANAEINDYEGVTYSVADFDEINCIKRKIVGRKIKKFDALKAWINEILPSKLFEIRDNQLLISYAWDGMRYHKGEVLTNKVFEPTGPQQLKSWCAHITRRTIFTNPRLGLCHFLDLYACIFALIMGRAANENEIPSASTIRCNIARLKNLDLHDQRREYLKLSQDLSLCGNS